MTRFFCPAILFIFIATQAQIHEIGFLGGGSNFVGDVGSTMYVNPSQPAFGLVYKWNKSPRHSYRFGLNATAISANDIESDDPSRLLRKLRFSNNVLELSAGLEFNFFDFNLHEGHTKVTPYIYSGLNYLIFNEFKENQINEQAAVKKGTFAIPFTVGIKSNIFYSLILAAEVGARYTMTDNLDGSNPKIDNAFKFGNINNNDWYVLTGLTLTYTFGVKPCYCAE